jgi:hypothetical protein
MKLRSALGRPANVDASRARRLRGGGAGAEAPPSRSTVPEDHLMVRRARKGRPRPWAMVRPCGLAAGFGLRSAGGSDTPGLPVGIGTVEAPISQTVEPESRPPLRPPNRLTTLRNVWDITVPKPTDSPRRTHELLPPAETRRPRPPAQRTLRSAAGAVSRPRRSRIARTPAAPARAPPCRRR